MGEKRVDLLGPVRLLHEHLTAALCETVFRARRVSERRRIWTLHRLVEFWTAVILRAPESLRQALDEVRRGTGGYPSVQATPEAFFARAKGLRWEFFRDLFDVFVERIVGERGGFEKELRKELGAFAEVLVVDGSGLDAVAHRLKILWDERAVVLPGSLLVFYDLFRGLPRRVLFYAEAFGNEVVRLEGALDALPKGVLLVGDRAYASPRLFAGLTARGLFAVARRAKHLRIERLERLRRETSTDGWILEDILVLVGSGIGVEPQKLRLIRRRKGAKALALLTNVLDPQALSAELALRLYRRRWSVERMFYDLKEVLNLRRFYAANVNAVAMQVYASALVYVAMRTAQSRVATSLRIDPERLSTEKLFPKIAVASHDLAVGEIVFAGTQDANPEVALREPDWDAMPFASADASVVIVEPRRANRRRRRYCAARGNHASLHTFTRRKHR